MEFENVRKIPDNYRVKFIRVGEKFFVDSREKPDEATYTQIAEEDGILEEIKELKNEDPGNVDAGLLRVHNKSKEIEVLLGSDELELPPFRTAPMSRTITGVKLRKLAPDYKVDAKLNL